MRISSVHYADALADNVLALKKFVCYSIIQGLSRSLPTLIHCSRKSLRVEEGVTKGGCN